MTLAHHGVLFLDEAVEFSLATLEGALECLERGQRESHSHAQGTVRMPTRPQVVAAANPCPCGHGRAPRCRCTEVDVVRHRNRILRVRGIKQIDIWAHLEPVELRDLAEAKPGRSSEEIAGNVARARAMAIARQGHLNSDMVAQEATERVARTIADLDDSDDVMARHDTEAQVLCRKWQT